jgi:hypothetical protein
MTDLSTYRQPDREARGSKPSKALESIDFHRRVFERHHGDDLAIRSK